MQWDCQQERLYVNDNGQPISSAYSYQKTLPAYKRVDIGFQKYLLIQRKK
jgi:hypothetical protein